jgi:CRISPR-associated protein Csb2
MSNAPYRDLIVQALVTSSSEARLCRASVAATKIVAFQSNDLTTQSITVARYVLESSALPAVQQALPIAEKVRRALIRNRVDTSHSEAITGKTKEGVPLQGHRHAHYFVTDEDGDGFLDHLTIYAPCGFDRGDLEALTRTRTIFRRGSQPDIRMMLVGLGVPGDFSQNVGLFARARKWRSVTPFSLPRFATRGAGGRPRPRDLPEAQLMRELRLRRFSEPISIQRTPGFWTRDGQLIPWSQFAAERLNGKRGYGICGFTIEFAESVQGPLALGFGCHFSLGLFLPFEQE